MNSADGSIEVLTAAENYAAVKDAMSAVGLVADQSELGMHAEIGVAVEGETARQVGLLLERLEELDDVQAVYSNADLPADAWV